MKYKRINIDVLIHITSIFYFKIRVNPRYQCHPCSIFDLLHF